MNEDFLDMLQALQRAGARFMVIGAHALAGHGIVRATGDLDLWVEASPDNAERVWRALLDFGAPITTFGITREDFCTPDTVIQVGQAPRRIDLLTSATGLEFATAWQERLEVDLDGLVVPLLGRQSLIDNKRAVGRPQDLADVDALQRATTNHD